MTADTPEAAPQEPTDTFLPETPGFYLAVGEAVRAWARLENSLWFLAAQLLGTDQFRAQIVMLTLPNGRAQRELISRLAETFLQEPFLSRVRTLMNQVGTLSKTRNYLVHDMFSVDEDGELLHIKDHFGDRRGPLQTAWNTLPMQKVVELRNSTQTLQHQMIVLCADIAQSRAAALPSLFGEVSGGHR
ncbi:MAG: hypothetical protein K0Q43_5182 [Ramlibacter sp.]|jgi:hypothetical protein|nr:hypothetical protein [Ramlibacter sp.]MDF2466947.1 hypothetical protein [Ramlibacter sp.]